MRKHEAARRVPARRHEAEHDELPRLRARRDGLQPAAGHLPGEQEGVDGRHASGGRRRQRAVARWSGHGDAVGAHAARVARGLPAHRPARLLPHLRGVRARHRLDVQPAREVAGHQQEPRTGARRSPPRTSCCRRPSGGRTTTGSRTRTPASSTWWRTRDPSVVRVYLPPDANTPCRSPITACARTTSM